MRILTYDEVDPVGVLNLNLLSLDWPLTPDLATQIRHLDPRPFPFFGLYAVEDDTVAGQVLVYRLPAVTIEGPEDLGAVAAVATHPAFSHRGIAARLMEGAQARMRTAGLRFSTLGTTRHRMAHLLYQRLGYEDVLSFGSAFCHLVNIHSSSNLRAEPASLERLPLLDVLFQGVAAAHLGFARRHEPFFPIITHLGDVNIDQIWLLFDKDRPVGYAIANISGLILKVSDLLLDRVDPLSAVLAIARAANTEFIQARINHPTEQESYNGAGFQIAQPAWGTFMMKPLLPDLTVADARHLLSIGTERFLISWLDTT